MNTKVKRNLFRKLPSKLFSIILSLLLKLCDRKTLLLSLAEKKIFFRVHLTEIAPIRTGESVPSLHWDQENNVQTYESLNYKMQ